VRHLVDDVAKAPWLTRREREVLLRIVHRSALRCKPIVVRNEAQRFGAFASYAHARSGNAIRAIRSGRTSDALDQLRWLHAAAHRHFERLDILRRQTGRKP
jgi:hypothetical protein